MKKDHLVTFRSGIIKTQIDYFLIKVINRRLCKDCKMIPSECLGTQHKLLIMDVVIERYKGKKRGVADPRVRWCNLTRKNIAKLCRRLKHKVIGISYKMLMQWGKI